MKRIGIVVAALVGAAVVAVVTVLNLGPSQPPPFDEWPDSTFGAVVLDRGAPRFEYRSHERFRAASLTKLLIALDVLERPGALTGPDRPLVTAMLRASDDDAASVLWARHGAPDIVRRTASRLGLADTAPPSSRSSWGYTATSAADVARVYQYLLGADPAVRDAVLGDLRATTRCAVDGRDQLFGVPAAVSVPSPVKQGWSGFGDVDPAAACTPAPPSAVDPAADDRERVRVGPAPSETGSEPDVDVDLPAAHTSGVVGESTVVVVLSLHPEGTSYDEAARRLDVATRALVAAPAPAR